MFLEIGIPLCVAAFGILSYAVSTISLRQRRTHCPTCGSLALDTYDFVRATEVDSEGRRVPSWWTKHRCTSCGASFVRYNGGGLITREAFDAGARVALPKATVVRRQDEPPA